ncbi:hypothetical protein MPSEU_000014500 [Mayamaea pseudoterrestris]|nr:hypothetical protein MPSEU_000014500 [Mayamaea pseudoterrestris]
MVKPKKILNDPARSVDEFIEGLLLQYPNSLQKLSNHHVVLAVNRIKSGQVALVSGGGSGHEPSHAGWLDGSGMLTAAVCGGIFASPSVNAILAAIRVVAPADDRGVLLIIKNYTGDRLNFGMAAERAAQEHISTEMVVVADDCALERTKGITGARGVAGTVLIHKIAGAAAAAGKSLQEVASLARSACRLTGSLGVSMNNVTVPGADSINERLDEHTIEIGLGIHGEAGLKQSPLKSANDLAEEMIATIQQYGRIKDDNSQEIVPFCQPGDEVVLLVNNLGGTSNFEMSILARSCVRVLEGSAYKVKASRVLVGAYMTSFDMHGASITLMNVSGRQDLLELLDAPTSAPAWHACDIWSSGDIRPSLMEVPEKAVVEAAVKAKEPELEVADFAATSKALVTRVVQKLIESEPLLTKYDTIVGDGDCGITFKRGAVEILEQLEKGTISLHHPVPMFSSIADAVSKSMGGTSGVLIELMFRKMSSTLSRMDKIGALEICKAFQAGVDAVSLYGGAKEGSRTMLDALVPSAQALLASQSLTDAAVKAREGAKATAEMKHASAGRSNYLSEEQLTGTPDPGAEAVAIAFESITK